MDSFLIKIIIMVVLGAWACLILWSAKRDSDREEALKAKANKYDELKKDIEALCWSIKHTPSESDAHLFIMFQKHGIANLSAIQDLVREK